MGQSMDFSDQKYSFLYQVYQNLLQRMGDKQYYPEIQNINKQIKRNLSENNSIPSNRIMLKSLYALLITVVKRIYHKLFWGEQWFLLFNFGSKASNYEKYSWIMPPRDRFWADPHIIKNENTYFIFVEEYIYHKRKAHISVIELSESGKYTEPTTVLEQNYHLSYPFTFRYEGKYYMVPETSENKTIELYECTEFPYQWCFLMNLMHNAVAVDTTLFNYSNLWWMFTAMPEKTEALPKVKLFLYYSMNLFSEDWHPHPQNPVIDEFSGPRPAGKIFMKNGKIYRPAQDSSKGYGTGIFINEITRLSTDEYEEIRVESIQPNWNKKIIGAHTYSMDTPLTILDAYQRVPKILIRE
jgi:hypothetical protein